MEFVAEERKTESLAAYYAQLTEDQKRALQAVAMDMWEPYIGATRNGLPDGDAKIVFDRFHIMRDMTKAVDTVRKQEHREFLRAGDDSPLTRTKYRLAVQRRAATRASCRDLRDTPGAESESRPGVGDQGSLADAVDLPADRPP